MSIDTLDLTKFIYNTV